MTITINSDVTAIDLLTEDDILDLEKEFNDTIDYNEFTYIPKPVRSYNAERKKLHGIKERPEKVKASAIQK